MRLSLFFIILGRTPDEIDVRRGGRRCIRVFARARKPAGVLQVGVPAQLPEAEALWRDVLTERPDYPPALRGLAEIRATAGVGQR